jgi:type III secretion system HrpE/YscL family protein
MAEGNLKSDRPRAPSGSQTKLATALAEAQSIIEAAEQRAAEVRSEAERSYLESREQGYQDGLRQGQTAAAGSAVRLIAESSTVGDRLADEAARLALAICKTAIGEHLKVEPEVVKRLAVHAFRESVVGEAATVIVHPDDRQTLERSVAQLRRVAGGAAVSLDTDPSLTRGGCIVRTDFGEVDATIESLLEAVAAHLGIAQK